MSNRAFINYRTEIYYLQGRPASFPDQQKLLKQIFCGQTWNLYSQNENPKNLQMTDLIRVIYIP